MTKGCLEFENVVFFYAAAAEPVFEGLSCEFPAGWTGVIGPNGAGKTTLLRLACGQLAPSRGVIQSPARVIYCAQRTDKPPARLARFLKATDPLACELRGRLNIGRDWLVRWRTLSHGERKRAQIGVALWRRPAVLAADEPTNHIDLPARRLLAGAMRSFRGIGLLVSHDRELLDSLCGQCLFVEPPGAVMRPGGYTKAVELAKAEQEHARRRKARAKRELGRLRQEAADRRREASRSHRLRSKRGLKPKEHDARGKIDRARYTGKDGQAGRLLRQMEGRLKQAGEKLAGIRVRKQRRLGIEVRGERSKRDALFRLPVGVIELGGGRQLAFPELIVRPDDRVALTGPNGGGKSTLVRHIVARLDLPAGRAVYVAQEIDAAEGKKALAAARRLSRRRLGDVMSVIGSLGSEPQQLLQSELPSPGEVRKLLLALGMAHSPHIIIMDEPTNHLDLPSIECLEDALRDVPCALLLVSHDTRFLENLTRIQWDISADEDDAAGIHMRLNVREMRGRKD